MTITILSAHNSGPQSHIDKTMASMKRRIETGGQSRKTTVIICKFCHTVEVGEINNLKGVVLECQEEFFEDCFFCVLATHEVVDIANWDLIPVS
jgi:hypothetical protein